MTRRRRRSLGVLALVLLLAAAALAATLGWLSVRHERSVVLPSPRGSQLVGRLITTWADSSRTERLGGAGGARRLSVWIWYPARAGGSPAPYLPPVWARARDAQRGAIAGLLFQASSSIRSHAWADAPPARDGAPFPVLVFEPGFGRLVAEYATLAEDLASRGYVVIGLNPTYSAAFTVLDGKVIPRSAAGSLPADAAPAVFRRRADRLVGIWAADDRFAMDRAARLAGARGGPLAGVVDARRIGLWGHSLGGAAALEACRLDPRCAGAVDLDGWPFGEVARLGLDRPVLYVSADVAPTDEVARRAEAETAAILARAPLGCRVTIAGSRHFNFTDDAAGFSPVEHLLGMLGPIDGPRGLELAADDLDAFFGQVLRGRAAVESEARCAGVAHAGR